MAIFIIDDNPIMADCIARICKTASIKTQFFPNAVAALSAIDQSPPDLIFLDILLPGPDGFTLLNELVSYPETAQIPVVLVSSLPLSKTDFSAYGVVGYLNKETMTPKEILTYVRKYSA